MARPARSRALPLAAVALSILLVLGSVADAVEPADHDAMRTVVDRQIEAFRADDFDRAFAMASPALKALFGSPTAFSAMVRQGYGPVYRPRRYTFGASRDGGTGPELSVLIEDQAGQDWTAIYSFEQQPDGTWAVSGCRLVKTPELAA